jgi:hypothetical protein
MTLCFLFARKNDVMPQSVSFILEGKRISKTNGPRIVHDTQSQDIRKKTHCDVKNNKHEKCLLNN